MKDAASAADPAHRLVGEPGPGPGPDFERLYDEHARLVWRLLRNMGVWPADVADVAQDVFVIVYRRLPEVEIRTSLRAWIYGICIRAAANYRRRSCHTKERLFAEVPDRVCPVSDSADKLDLRAALAALDEARRAVFVLYEIEELTMSEVAEALGCPLTTLYSRLYSARRFIRAALSSSADEKVG